MVGIPNDKKWRSHPLTWSAGCQAAFEALKEALSQAPIVAYAVFTQPFTLYADASHQGWGRAQVHDEKEHFVAYASRSLHPT